MEKIVAFDKAAFLFFNGYHNVFFDNVMWLISHKFTWIPLYLILLYLLFRNYGKQAFYLLPAIFIVILLADQISVKLFKEVFERLRPCHDPELAGLVHIVKDHCGGKFGFVSSHATNTFALAGFLALVLRRRYSRVFFWMILWASVVSYSRIYLGVHFPLDVLGGAILGGGIGCVVYMTLKWIDKVKSLQLEYV